MKRCEHCHSSTLARIARAGMFFCSETCGDDYFCTPEETEIHRLQTEVAKRDAALLRFEAIVAELGEKVVELVRERDEAREEAMARLADAETIETALDAIGFMQLAPPGIEADWVASRWDGSGGLKYGHIHAHTAVGAIRALAARIRDMQGNTL